MGAMGYIPMQQAMNPVEAASVASGTVNNIVSAMNQMKLSAVQKALMQQQLTNQATMAPLQQQEQALKNRGLDIENQWAPQLNQANVDLREGRGYNLRTNADTNASKAPSVIDSNEARANQSNTKADLNTQQNALHQDLDPITVQSAQTKLDALPGQLADNSAYIKAKMNDLGVHAFYQNLLGPTLVAHMNATTDNVNSLTAKNQMATAAMAKALADPTFSKDPTAPQNVVRSWDLSAPGSVQQFVRYTQLYMQNKLDPTGMKTMADKDGSFVQGVQNAGGAFASGLVNQFQQNQQQSSQMQAGINQLLNTVRQPPPGPGGPISPSPMQNGPPAPGMVRPPDPSLPINPPVPGGAAPGMVNSPAPVPQSMNPQPMSQPAPAPGGANVPPAPGAAPMNPTPQPGQPQAMQQTGPKPLDPQTAMQFMQMAGGNKMQARALAIQAGYSLPQFAPPTTQPGQ